MKAEYAPVILVAIAVLEWQYKAIPRIVDLSIAVKALQCFRTAYSSDHVLRSPKKPAPGVRALALMVKWIAECNP